MKQAFCIFLIFCSLQVFSQDCNNPLLSAFNLSALDSPQSSQDYAYCNNTQNNQTCCSNETVSAFQSRLDSQTQGLYNLIAARDLYLSSLNEKFIGNWFDLSDDINESLNDMDGFQFEQLPNSSNIQSQINLLYNISDELRDIRGNFYWNLRKYQLARGQCLKVVLEVQASIWCLACDPNYANNGVSSNGSIAFSNNLCQTISDACYPFLDAGVQFNPILRARQNYQQLLKLSNNLRSYTSRSCDTSDDNSIYGDNYIPSFDEFYRPISSQKSVHIPSGCDSKNCSWQCENLFSNNAINQEILANGAGILGSNSQTANNKSANNQSSNNDTNSSQLANNQTDNNQTQNNTSQLANNQTNDNQTDSSQPAANNQTSDSTNNSSAENNSTWSPTLNATGLNINPRSDPGYVFWLLDDKDYRRQVRQAKRAELQTN